MKWEPLKKKQIFQCKNCQRVRYATTGCGMGYRCVKCLETHNPGECLRNGENAESTPAACVNCQKTGHTANYRGCPYLKYTQMFIDNAKKRNGQHQESKNQKLYRKTTASVSYAQSVVKSNIDLRNKSPSANDFNNIGNYNNNALKTQQGVTSNQTTSIQTPAITMDQYTDLFNNFKDGIISVSEKNWESLQAQIQANSNKIELIANYLNLKWE